MIFSPTNGVCAFLSLTCGVPGLLSLFWRAARKVPTLLCWGWGMGAFWTQGSLVGARCVSSVVRTIWGSWLCSQRCEVRWLPRGADLFLTQPQGIIFEVDNTSGFPEGQTSPPRTGLGSPLEFTILFFTLDSHSPRLWPGDKDCWLPVCCPISEWGGRAGLSAWRGCLPSQWVLPEALFWSQRRAFQDGRLGG